MDALERYIHDFSSPEEELLHELDRQTHLQVVQPRMLSGLSLIHISEPTRPY